MHLIYNMFYDENSREITFRRALWNEFADRVNLGNRKSPGVRGGMPAPGR